MGFVSGTAARRCECKPSCRTVPTPWLDRMRKSGAVPASQICQQGSLPARKGAGRRQLRGSGRMRLGSKGTMRFCGENVASSSARGIKHPRKQELVFWNWSCHYSSGSRTLTEPDHYWFQSRWIECLAQRYCRLNNGTRGLGLAEEETILLLLPETQNTPIGLDGMQSEQPYRPSRYLIWTIQWFKSGSHHKGQHTIESLPEKSLK